MDRAGYTIKSARNLGFIFDEHHTFCDQINLSPKPVTITFINFTVFGLTSIRELPAALLPLSSTPNLITVIIPTINYPSLHYPVSSRSRTLLHVLTVIHANWLKTWCTRDIKNFFQVESLIGGNWNLLDQRTLDAPTINAFKYGLCYIRDNRIRMGFFMD